MSHDAMRWRADERGSLPLALLAVIIVAGLASVLIARVVVGERTVRFDNTYTRELHTADAGVAEALFHISEDVEAAGTPISSMALGDSRTISATVDAQEYDVEIKREGIREWRITSVARPAGAVAGTEAERTIVAEIVEEPLFFPGAFGDDIVALNGTSSFVDSYHSTDPDPYSASPTTCNTAPEKCAWGWPHDPAFSTGATFGTGNGSIGTNGVLDLSGGVDVRPGGAFLYDWEDNPGTGPTESNPFGNRCNGTTRCTSTFVSTILDPLVYATDEKMGFIDGKFDGGGCDTDPNPAVNSRYDIPGRSAYVGSAVTQIGSTHSTETWTPYVGTDPTNDDATDLAFTDYYCAENLAILGDVVLDAAVTPSNPVVIFVKDGLSIPNPGTFVACHNHDSSVPCNGTDDRAVRPVSDRLQIYVAGTPASAVSSNDVQVKSQGMIAGVFYAPRSRCGGTGGAGADVYGILLCGSMDNVGNWDFHFDDRLADRGAASFAIGSWSEE